MAVITNALELLAQALRETSDAAERSAVGEEAGTAIGEVTGAVTGEATGAVTGDNWAPGHSAMLLLSACWALAVVGASKFSVWPMQRS